MSTPSDSPVPDVNAQTVPYKHPLLWVPTSYFTMGLIYQTIVTAATIIFINMGMPNKNAVVWSSLLGWPYVAKFLWAPILELYKTKKFFVVLMQIVLPILLAAAALCLRLPGESWTTPVLVFIGLTAVAGATQDIGSDGVYVTTLDAKNQAKFTGFQSMCWNIGPIVATGPLVGLSGLIHKYTGKWDVAWMVVLLVTAAITLSMGVYHYFMLPAGTKAQGSPGSVGDAMRTFGRAFASFFDKKGIIPMIAFALFYRSAYGMMEKMGPVFMINARSVGGLGLSNEMFSAIYGFGGSVAFIIGSLLGGLAVSRYGLKRSILVLCLCLNVPNITFLYLSQTLPMSLAVVTAVVVVEKLAWGFGAVAHMLYMMQQIAPGPYKTAHYSIATGLMGLCMIGVGMLSGVLQEAVGFKTFFVIALAAMIPSILVTLFAPFHVEDVTKKGPASEPAA